MYQCPSCSAGLIFDPKEQKMKCNYCNNLYDPKEIEKINLQKSKGEDGSVYNALVYRCTQCGAELITTDETISTFCSYCGSSALLEKRNEKKQKPNYIIPFIKTKEECEQAYRNKLRRSFFAPKNMSDDQQVEKIRGIYMPHWIYSFEKNGPSATTASKYSRRVGDYVYYTDYRITTQINAKCSGITHDATSNFYDSLSEAIAPYSIKDKKEFSPTYLSGFYADSEDLEKGTYIEECGEMADKQASEELAKDSIYLKYNAKPHVYMEPMNTELGLFPVYFLATKNKKGDRISYAVVNGQTGKVAAEIPIDFKKYVITSLILAIPIFIMLNMFLTLTPKKVLFLGILFGLLSFFISNRQINKITLRENHLEDKGFMAKNNKLNIFKKDTSSYNNIFIAIMCMMIGFPTLICITLVMTTGKLGLIAMGAIFSVVMILLIPNFLRKLKNKDKNKNNHKFKEKIKKTYKPLIGIGLAILIMLLNPVSDIYYYGATIVSILMTIWSFYDIIKELNLLTTRKLPQLEKRGGDENA